MATISSKEVVKKLEAAGWIVVRQTGSHIILRSPTGRTVPVPGGRKDLAIGTVRSIERITGVKLL